MVFFLEITKICQRPKDFWFAEFFLEILKIHRLVWIFLRTFGCFECVSSMFCLKLFLNFTNASKAKMTFEYPPPPPKEIHRLGPMDLRIYSLEGNPRL
jgi:hypothetical protein